MVSKLFIDSDVVIDFFTDREPFANPASEIFDLNEQGKIEAIITRNVKDYEKSEIAVFTPENYLKSKVNES